MASRDRNKPIEFVSHDNKRYRKTIGRDGKTYYTVTDLNTKANSKIDAKKFAQENSRYHAKKRMADAKAAKEQKIREEAEAKAAAELAAKLEKERKEREAKSIAEANRKIQAEKEAKRKESARQIKELNDFLNSIIDQGDDIALVTRKLNTLHNNYIKIPYLRGLAKRYFTLSESYGDIDKKLGDLYKKVSKAKAFTEEDVRNFDRLVDAIPALDNKFDALQKEEKVLTDAHDAKENDKAEKRRKATRKRRENLVKAGRKRQETEAKRNAGTQKTQDKESAKGIADRRAETRSRRIQAVAEGREKQERERQEAMEQFIRSRKGKRDSLDKFFSKDNTGAKVLLGSASVIGAPLKALGFDFADEIETLGTLFAPAKMAFKGIHSLSQKMMGLDDATLDGLDNESKTGKKQNKNELKDLKNALKKMKHSKPNLVKNIFNKIRNQNSSSTSNSTSNNTSNGNAFNSSKSFASANSGFTTNYSQTSNNGQSGPDLNRTDDSEWFKLDVERNVLLEKILKALGGPNAKNKSGMFGGLGGKAGLVGAGVVGAAILGSHIKNEWSQMSEDRSAVSSVNKTISTNRNTIIEKMRNRKASQEDIEMMQYILEQEQHYKTNGDKESETRIIQQRKELLKKYGLVRTNAINNNDVNNSSNVSSLTEKDRAIIKATEVEKIERIKDEKMNLDGMMEEFKKFLTETFAPLLAGKIAGSLGGAKNSGKHIMPPANPF